MRRNEHRISLTPRQLPHAKVWTENKTRVIGHACARRAADGVDGHLGHQLHDVGERKIGEESVVLVRPADLREKRGEAPRREVVCEMTAVVCGRRRPGGRGQQASERVGLMRCKARVREGTAQAPCGRDCDARSFAEGSVIRRATPQRPQGRAGEQSSVGTENSRGACAWLPPERQPSSTRQGAADPGVGSSAPARCSAQRRGGRWWRRSSWRA